MTDRLTIAAQILAGWTGNPSAQITDPDAAAQSALKMADALLAAAEKPAVADNPLSRETAAQQDGDVLRTHLRGWQKVAEFYMGDYALSHEADETYAEAVRRSQEPATAVDAALFDQVVAQRDEMAHRLAAANARADKYAETIAEHTVPLDQFTDMDQDRDAARAEAEALKTRLHDANNALFVASAKKSMAEKSVRDLVAGLRECRMHAVGYAPESLVAKLDALLAKHANGGA